MSNLAYIPNDYARGYVASQSDSRKGVRVPLSFIDLCDGNMYDAILFSQIMYWHEPSKDTGETRLKKLDDDGYLWLYKNHSDWYKECRIKTQTARKCLERLKASGLIAYKLSGAEGNATPHMRIDWDVFERKMRELETPQKKSSKIIQLPEIPVTQEHTPVTTEQGGLLPQNTPLLQQVKSNTENTTESIPEITKKKKESAPTARTEKKPLSPFEDTSHAGLFKVIAKHSFNFDEGETIPKGMAGRIGKVVNAVREMSPAVTVAEVVMAYRYAKNTSKRIPDGEITLVALVQEFRKSVDYRLYESHKAIALNTDMVSQSVAAPPVVTTISAPVNPPPEWVAAQPDYGTPDENAELERMFADLVDSKRSKKLVGKLPPTLKDVS